MPNPGSQSEPFSAFHAEDPLGYWRIRSLEYAGKVGLPLDAVNDAIGVLQNVFGETWLRSEAMEATRATPLPFSKHPLGNSLKVPGPEQLVEVVELVEYLKFAGHSKTLPELTRGLKSSYHATLLQLAFGYRLDRAGVSGVEFEPPVEGGLLGDIGGRLGPSELVVECYAPTVRRNPDEGGWLLNHCMELFEGKDSVFSLAIQLSAPLTSTLRKRLVRRVAESLNELDLRAATAKQLAPVLLQEDDGALISIALSKSMGAGEPSRLILHPQFPIRDDNTDYFARVASAPAELVRLGRLPDHPAETRSHVAIWLSESERMRSSRGRSLEEPLAALTGKLGRKLRQTRLGTALRFIIVRSWIASEWDRAPAEAVRTLRHRLFGVHKNVAGLLVVTRERLPAIHRIRYRMIPVLPESPVQEVVRLVSQLQQDEERLKVPPLATSGSC